MIGRSPGPEMPRTAVSERVPVGSALSNRSTWLPSASLLPRCHAKVSAYSGTPVTEPNAAWRVISSRQRTETVEPPADEWSPEPRAATFTGRSANEDESVLTPTQDQNWSQSARSSW
jgi:hypothetical protein